MESGTEGVRILRGEPEKAIVRLSIPIMVSNLVFTLYNFADGVWVAGLGADSLSAIGLFMPLFFMFISLSMGLGIGAGSAISRKIGAKDKEGADNVAMHAIILSFILGLGITSVYFRLNEIMILLGAQGDVLVESIKYANIMVLGSIFLVFNNVSVGILNGEGNAKRAMYANVSGSILNIILDPILIYVLGFGIAGAALASVASMIVSSLMIVYWMFYNSKTYVSLDFKKFRASSSIILDIFRVGIPSAFAMLAMSISIMILNLMIVTVGGADRIAVFTSAWRVVHFGFIPLFGFAGAGTAVMGSAYGAKQFQKMERAYKYAISPAIKIELAIATLFIISSPVTAMAFSYSPDSARLYDDIVSVMRVLPLFLPVAPLGIITSSMFQGMGKGERSFIITLLRTIVLQITFAYILAFIADMGFFGIIIGIVSGNILTGFIAFGWGLTTIKKLKEGINI